jgi:hypothetical protein
VTPNYNSRNYDKLLSIDPDVAPGTGFFRKATPISLHFPFFETAVISTFSSDGYGV